MRSFLALSRSTHGVLDIAMPGFAALLWLGHFPRWPVLLVALLTALAGYTALYALNDIIGVKVDREKFAGAGPNAGYSVEASDLRYPIAQGKLSLGKGIAWFSAWFVIALIGAYWLNPLLVWVVLAAPILETVYCLLFKVSWWRVLVSGVVKSLGPVAAVLAVVPRPDPALLGLMVAWLMAWEIGGQNVPADWNDVEEDRRVGARTIPLVFGEKVAGRVVVVALLATLALGWLLPRMAAPELGLGLRFQLGMLAIGVVLLLIPGVQLLRSHEGRRAAKLFDRASLYPLALLALITAWILLG
ncbi:MAG: UbiA family prenyltransferase [Thermomonas sp.]|uniref:UbiA family prenyltransferase n=1 Tax=Thermomonas sp. TaxID=1971895 RepID=UPI00260B54EA|nr:UbiA family prenyltransferase [Thermomonas sp.]MCC7096322.1 UbiA family prenyltransferase [Thermomonas sp.]